MKHSLILLIVFLLFSVSCSKTEGLGGTSSVEGKVYVLDYNQELTTKLGEYYGADIDVFIIYGDDNIYSDDFATSYDGSYRFENLQPGNYKVFAYSEDTTGISEGNIFPVFKDFTINEKGENIVLDDIVIVK